MKKQLKYLISLFLVFGLMVNDGAVYSPSHSVDYYQYSNGIVPRASNSKDSKVYIFNKVSSKTTSFPILLAYLKFKDIDTLRVPVLLKTRTLLYQKVSAITSQYIFINEIITSKNSLKSSYIA